MPSEFVEVIRPVIVRRPVDEDGTSFAGRFLVDGTGLGFVIDTTPAPATKRRPPLSLYTA
jgi:hypothetical protein